MPLAEMTFSSVFGVAYSKKHKIAFLVVILTFFFFLLMCTVALLINVLNTCHAETRGVYTEMAGWELRLETDVPNFVLDFFH